MTNHAFIRNLEVAWPPGKWQEQRQVIAVSGGPDSVALLSGICELSSRRDRVVVAHFNHGLRSEGSHEDERFLELLCDELNVSLQIGRASPGQILSLSKGEGVESAAREARYDFLREYAESIGARYILTGHTADDQAETVLHNIMRGTGLAGLSGIPRSRNLNEAVTIVRPLLGITREEVESYLHDLGRLARTDPTNVEQAFTRNRIRNKLIPLIEQEFNEAARVHFNQLARLIREVLLELDSVTERLDSAIGTRSSRSIVIRTAPFHGESEFLASHFLMRVWREQNWPQQAMTFSHWRRIAKMLCDPPSESTAIDFPHRMRGKFSSDCVVLTRQASGTT